jgi:hypothetical protein
MKGTFWNNTEMAGKPFTTEYYTKPVNVTTAGMHVFAPNLPIEDFSAKYETTFTAKEAGEYVVNVEATGHFELYINGKQQFVNHIWRATPTRTVLNAAKGEQFQIEVRFQTVKTWGASMKIDVARELAIDYQQTIAQLNGIDKRLPFDLDQIVQSRVTTVSLRPPHPCAVRYFQAVMGAGRINIGSDFDKFFRLIQSEIGQQIHLPSPSYHLRFYIFFHDNLATSASTVMIASAILCVLTQ